MSFVDRDSENTHELETPARFNIDTHMIEMLSLTERGTPETWGSTPLNPHREDIRIQQKNLNEAFDALFPVEAGLVPFDINESTAHFIRDMNMSRVRHRVEKNFDSYQYRGLFDYSSLPECYIEIIDRAEKGHASPAELIFVSKVLSVPTVELASLTHPYGLDRLRDHLEPMRNAVQTGIEVHGGVVLRSSPQYVVRSVNFPSKSTESDISTSLLVTRTVTVGMFPVLDAQVFERSSFVLRLDLLDLTFSRAILSAYQQTGSLSAIEDVAGFNAAMTELLDADAHHVAVPISTTSFMVNHTLVQDLLKNDTHSLNRRRMLLGITD